MAQHEIILSNDDKLKCTPRISYNNPEEMIGIYFNYTFYQISMNVMKEMVDAIINAIIQMVHSYVLVKRDIT